MSIGSTQRWLSARSVGVFFLALSLLAPAFARDPKKNADPDAPASTGANGKTDHHDDPAGRAEWFLAGRRILGENSALLLQRAYRQKMRMRQQGAQQMQPQQSAATSQTNPGNLAPFTPVGPAWQPLGPAPITGMGSAGNASGRISAVTVDQNDPTGNTVFVGGAYGGVWKSTNGAAADPNSVVWTPLYDADPNVASLAVGAISLQPGNNNVILVGTGEPTNSLLSYYGMGILRSTDGGASWTSITSADSGVNSFRGLGVAKFAWSTTNQNLVVAAFSTGTIGDRVGIAFGSPGMYVSTDAGATWSLSSNGSSWTDLDDVVFRPTDGKFYAFASSVVPFGGSGGVFSSSNGSTWTRLTNQPGSVASAYRGQLALRADDGELFASWVDGNEGLGGVFRSLDGGATAWTSLTGTGNGITTCGDSAACGGYQGFYNQYVIAAPNGASTDVYFGAGNVFKCTATTSQTCNATTGTTNRWLNLTHVYGTCDPTYLSIHPDQHTADYLLSNPNIVYFGNDGGAYRTLSAQSGGMVSGVCNAVGTSNAFNDLNTSSLGSLSQFISFSQHPTKADILVGGTQDNGSPGFSTVDGQTVGLEGYEANGGDGGFNAIDQTDPRNWYTAFTDVTITKCVGGTNQTPPFPGADSESACLRNDFFTQIIGASQVGGDHGAFYTPYLLDPADQSKIIVGTCRVWRGSTSGANLTAISPKLLGGTTCTGSTSGSLKTLLAGGPVVSGVSSVIYAGFGGGNIFVSTNAGAATPTWTDRSGGINPSGFPISSFAIDPAIATGQTAYVTIMGFTNPNGSGHVFKTTNAGQSWTDVSTGLPNAPADGIVVDPRDSTILYVATDVGVFVSNNGGSTWQEYGSALPAVPVMGMRIFNNGVTKKLRVATHGRGVWQIDLFNAADYSLNVSNSPLTTYATVAPSTLTGTLTAAGSYNSPVNLSCDAGGGGTVPSTCAAAVTPVTPTQGGAPFTVNVNTNVTGDFTFNVKGVGTDGSALTRQQAVTVHFINFSTGDGADGSLPRGSQYQTTFALVRTSNWPNGRAINGSCNIVGGPITGMSCSVSPPSLATDGDFTLTVTTSAATPTGPVTVNFTATDSGDNTKTRQQSVIITVQPNVDFSLALTTPPPSPDWPGQLLGAVVQQTFHDGYTPPTTIHYSCAVTPSVAFHPPFCNTTASNSLNGGISLISISLRADLVGDVTPAGDYTVSLTGDDGNGKVHTINIPVHVLDYSLAVPASANVLSGATTDIPITLTPSNGTENSSASCSTQVAKFLYIANRSAGTISGYLIAANGAPSAVSGNPFAAGANPSGVAVDPSGRFLYAANDGSNNVSAFTIDANSGALTPISGSPFTAGTGAFGVVVDPTGNFLFVSNETSNNVSAFTINSSTGALTPAAGSPFAAGTTPQALALDPSGRFLYAANVGTHNVSGYAIAPNTGVLTPMSSSPFPGLSFPISGVAVDPTGKFLHRTYTTNGALNGGVLDRNIGTLLQGVPPGGSAGTNPSGVAVHVSGRFLYVSNAGSNDISLLSIDGNTGSLTAVGTPVGAGTTPRALALDPSGSFLYVANEGNNTISVYSVNSGNGALTPVAGSPFAAGANDPFAVAVASQSGTSCSITPSSPIAMSSAVNATMHITLPAGVASGAMGTAHIITSDPDSAALVAHVADVVLTAQDFAITQGAVASNAIVPGQTTGIYNANLVPGAGFTSAVTLSCAGLPAGATCAFPVNPVTASGSTPFTFTIATTAGTTPIGNYTFHLKADVGGLSKNSPDYALAVQDYSLQTTPPATSGTPIKVLMGNSTTFTVSEVIQNGFSAPATLNCSSLPTGVTCPTIVPNPVTPATPATVTVNVSNGSAPGNATVPIMSSADDGAGIVGRSTFPWLAIQDFTVAATPGTRTVAVGAGANYTVNVTAQNGYAGLITLGCSAPPANVSCSFSPAAVTPGTPSTLTVLTTSSVSAGAKTITVTGTAEGQTRTAANVTLSVSATTPSFTLTMSTPTKTVNLGGSTTYSINVKSTTTTTVGTVTFACVTPLPTGVTCPTFSPASLSPNTTGTNVTATVQTDNTASVANLPITFQGTVTSSTQLKRISGTLQVQDYTLGVSPSSQVIPAPGGTTQYSVTLTGLNGFATSANLSCTGLPAGWTCGFVPASVAPTGGGASSTLTLTTTATPFGPSNFTVQATAGTLTHTQLISATNGTNDYQLVNAGSALVAVRPGQTANYSVQLNRFGTFSGQVNESCVYTATTPVGTACNITPNPADLTTGTCPGAGLCTTAALAIPTDSGTTVIGDYPFNFHGNGNASLHDVPLTLRVNDFSIASNTGSQTIQQTAAGTYTVTVTGLNNWTANVTLSCANITTTGLSCSFSQNNFVPAPGGTPVTVTLTAAGNAQIASGTFDVVATDGTTSHSKNLAYNVIAVQDFTFGNSTGTQTVLAGVQAALYSTTLTPLNAFGADVALVCTNLPANATCGFNPVSPVTIGSATAVPVTVSIQAASNTPAGNYNVTVTGTDPVSGKTHAVTLSLAVQSFTIALSPTTRTIPAGAGTTYTASITGQNGFAAPVLLGCVTPPAGVTCSFSPATASPGTPSTLTVTTATSITAGSKTIQVGGASGLGAPVVSTANATLTISSTTPSFTITDSTPTKVVPQGSSTTFTLSVKSTLTTSPGAVTMSCVAPLPVGVGCSFSPSSFTPTTTARTVTATVTTTAATPAQSFALQFQAATASQFKRASGTLQVADYSLDVQPATRTISSATGGTASYTATLTAIDGFNTSTTLSCPTTGPSPLPAGWSCAFSPATLTPTGAGAASTLTLTTTNSPLGPTNFTISALGGGITHTQQVQVINGQDFSLSAGSPITVNQNSNNTTSVNVTAVGTFAASVALSCSTVPPGFSCGFVPNSINPGTPSTLTISADNTVAGGQYTVTVQGQSSSPSLTHTANVTVNVPDFTVGLTGGASTVLRTQPLNLSGTATALGGFAASVPFSCSTGDVNVPCVAATPVTPLIGGAAVSVTVTPSAGATPGPYTVTLTGDDGAGHLHSANFGITVQDFSVAATDAGLSVENGTTTGSYSGSVTGASFTGNVALTCSSPTISVTCAFSPSSSIAASGGGTAFTFTITPTGAVGGPYVVNVTGTAGGVTHSATVHVTITASQDWSYTYQLATPQTQTVNAGQSAAYNIDLSPNNGFNSSVALTCAVTGAPAGVSCNIVGSPVAGGSGSITLNVLTTNGTVAPGAYSIVVTGNGGAKTRTTTATLNVRDFTLSVTPPTQTVTAGNTADYTVSTATTSGFPNNATLTCAVLTSPAGTGCSFDASPLAPGGSTLMHVSSTVATPGASYTVQVTATSGVTIHTFNVSYTVNNGAASDFTITTSTPTRTVTHGSPTSYSVTVTATGSFAESVTLACLGQPSGVACATSSFVPSASGTVKVINVLVGSTTVPGTYNFQIKGTSASKTHSVNVQLIVN